MSQPQFSKTPHQIEAIQSYIHIARPPVVIIGNGPVNMQAARELLRRNRYANIVIYENEHHQPYITTNIQIHQKLISKLAMLWVVWQFGFRWAADPDIKQNSNT